MPMPEQPNQGEQTQEYRIRFRDPTQGVDLTAKETTDAKHAGATYRSYREMYRGHDSGELSLEKRTVTRSPWEPVESIDLADKPA